MPGIVKFQAVQDRPGEVLLRLATDDRFPGDGAEQVRAKVAARLGEGNEIRIELVDDIAPSPSGKYRPVVGNAAAERMKQA